MPTRTWAVCRRCRRRSSPSSSVLHCRFSCLRDLWPSEERRHAAPHHRRLYAVDNISHCCGITALPFQILPFRRHREENAGGRSSFAVCSRMLLRPASLLRRIQAFYWERSCARNSRHFVLYFLPSGYEHVEFRKSCDLWNKSMDYTTQRRGRRNCRPCSPSLHPSSHLPEIR